MLCLPPCGFSVTPEKIPVADIITATETAIKQSKLDHSKAENLRHKINTTLCNAKLPSQNITKEERSALGDLTKDENIVLVHPADKGKCVVVLNKSDYNIKCQQLLKDKKTYKPIGYNPTSGYRKQVTDFVNKVNQEGGIDNSLKFKLTPPTEPSIPAFYRLPKVHKPEPIPVRPIISSIGSVTYNLAKHAAKLIGLLVGNSPHHLKNTQEFVGKIQNLKLVDDEIITSYDVTALFTCIPPVRPDDAIQVVRECLEKDGTLSERTDLSVDQIVELVTICLKTTYFSYNNKFFLQQHGCAMGSAVSPIVVNLYMERFEQEVLRNNPGTSPRLWLRYVDDTFIIIINKRESDNFFKYINEVDPNIRFTQEECVDDKLAFLDCHVHLNPDGSLNSTVYRKPTHTDHYLQFDSHHPLIHKLGVIRTLHYRDNTVISNPQDIAEEKDHIHQSLGNCGYPDWAFTKANKSKQPSQSPQSNKDDNTSVQARQVTIPYIAGVSERLKNSYKSFGISTAFKPINTLRGKVVHVKDKPPKDKLCNLVYGLTCVAPDCGESYVGETKQSLKARLNQHRRPSTNEAQNSAVYNHCKASNHSFKPEEVVILDKEDRWFVREAIWERVEQPALNKKGGLRFQLSHAWDEAIRRLPRRLSRDQSEA